MIESFRHKTKDVRRRLSIYFLNATGERGRFQTAYKRQYPPNYSTKIFRCIEFKIIFLIGVFPAFVPVLTQFFLEFSQTASLNLKKPVVVCHIFWRRRLRKVEEYSVSIKFNYHLKSWKISISLGFLNLPSVQKNQHFTIGYYVYCLNVNGNCSQNDKTVNILLRRKSC